MYLADVPEKSLCGSARLHPTEVTVLHSTDSCGADTPRSLEPGHPYPEIPFPDGPANPIYHALRELLRCMGLDPSRYGTPEWNPLGEWLRPGQSVVVKPNLVHHRHYSGGRLHWVVTDPRLIRAVCDYAFLAVGKSGEVIIGDAPLQSADWDSLTAETGLADLPRYYARHGFRLDLRDFRRLATTDVHGLKCSPRALPGDPKGYRSVDFGCHSLHTGRDWRRFRVTNYDPSEMTAHHNAEQHEYLIAGSVLAADVLINLPKLKTHRKAGLTCALKNLVGINGNKDWLPHHAAGSISEGGDEYAGISGWKRLSSWIVEQEETERSLARKLVWNSARKLVWKFGAAVSRDRSWEGSWHGNDTLWRTILDLNRAAMYAGSAGTLCEKPQRIVLTFVDAILAGEGEGPMSPKPVPMGCLLAGSNPLAVDIAATRLARWPEHVLRTISGAWQISSFPIAPFAPADLNVHCFDEAGRPVTLDTIAHHLAPSEGFRALFEAANSEACL